MKDRTIINNNEKYSQLVKDISDIFINGRYNAIKSINTFLIDSYWNIGKYIVEFEQNGLIKAEYGKELLANLSRDLLLKHGKGFSRSNLIYMRLFYIKYPISEKPSHQLSWSHYVELLKINEVKHQDIGQMNMYMGYFAQEENVEGDNPPIGIILTKDKNDLLVEYATYGMDTQLFVSKYQLYLPDREELKKLIEYELTIDN